jgi:hypothetical protein
MKKQMPIILGILAIIYLGIIINNMSKDLSAGTVSYKGININGVTCPLTKGQVVTATAPWGGINGPLGAVIQWIDTQGARTDTWLDVSVIDGYCQTEIPSCTGILNNGCSGDQSSCIQKYVYWAPNSLYYQCRWNGNTCILPETSAYPTGVCTLSNPSTTSTTLTTMPWQNPGNTQFITMTVLVAAAVALIIFMIRSNKG